MAEAEYATNNRLKYIKREMHEDAERTSIRIVKEFLDVPGLIGDGCQFQTIRHFINTFYKDTEYQIKDAKKKSKA